MAEQSLKPIIDKLENLFSKFNEKFYGGELQKPIITVSPDTTKGAYGWCTSWKAWSNKEPKAISEMKPEEVEAMKNEGFYEINLCAEHLARPFEHVAETLLMLYKVLTIDNFYKRAVMPERKVYMNKQRRRIIYEINTRLEAVQGEMESLLDDIQAVIDEETEYRDNIPENMQSGERYEMADSACDSLQSAYDTLESAKDNLDDVTSSLEEATDC